MRRGRGRGVEAVAVMQDQEVGRLVRQDVEQRARDADRPALVDRRALGGAGRRLLGGLGPRHGGVVARQALLGRVDARAALEVARVDRGLRRAGGQAQRQRGRQAGAADRAHCSAQRNCSRSLTFQNLPVEVLGIASRNSKRSGSCHLAKLPARCARSASGSGLLAGLEHHAGERPLAPLRVGDRDHRRFRHRGVRHQQVLHVDRADPLAARLDQVLGAVGDAHVAVRVERGDVAGAQPAVGGELLRARSAPRGSRRR